jgi:hypothetical protein
MDSPESIRRSRSLLANVSISHRVLPFCAVAVIQSTPALSMLCSTCGCAMLCMIKTSVVYIHESPASCGGTSHPYYSKGVIPTFGLRLTNAASTTAPNLKVLVALS